MKGTEKQIAWAEDIKRDYITFLTEAISGLRADYDRGCKHLAQANESGDAEKTARVQRHMSRSADMARVREIALLIAERADDASFFIDYRDFMHSFNDNRKFMSFVNNAIKRGYVSDEETADIPEKFY